MPKQYQPKTGEPCHCKPGSHRDNCPDCEGTGQRIDFRAIRQRVADRLYDQARREQWQGNAGESEE